MSTNQNKKLSRRDMLKLMGVTAAAGALAGCAPPATPAATQMTAATATSAPAATNTTAAQPTPTQAPEATATSAPVATNTTAAVQAGLPGPREDVLIYHLGTGQMTRSDGFNPYAPGAEDWGNGLRVAVLEHLWYPNIITGELKPWLATGHEYNSDYTTWTVHLRDKVKWSDGVAFSADDLVFTVDMMRNNPKLNNYQSWHDLIDTVTAKDALTVEFKFKEPRPRFHYEWQPMYGFDAKPIAPKHIWEKVDPLTFKNSEPVGTGPMKVVPTKPEDNMWLFERRDDYWAVNEGVVPPLEMKFFMVAYSPPQDAELAAMVRNEADTTWLDYTLLQKLIEQNPAWKVESSVPSPCPRGLYFNNALDSISKPEVRWAIMHCYDRQTVANTLIQPPGVINDYPWPPYEALKKFQNPEIPAKYPLTFDPSMAKQILDDLGFKPGSDGIRVDDKGKKMSFTFITWAPPGQLDYDWAAALATELSNIGVELNVKTMTDWPSFVDAWDKGEFAMTSSQPCVMRDPIDLYTPYLSKFYVPIGEKAQDNRARFQNKDYDAVVSKLQTINPDAPEAQALYDQALDIWMKNLPTGPGPTGMNVYNWNETYWTNWPSAKNPYTHAHIAWDLGKWWLQNLKKAKG